MTKKIYRFTASWCGPCKSLAKVLEGADLGVEFEVIDIDIEENQKLCEQYNLRGVPTLVKPEDGSALVGLKTLEEIKEWLGN